MAPSDAAAVKPPADVRRDIARRVALAHEPLLPGALAAMVFGSTVDGMADGRSDLDMGIVFDELPAEDELRAACQSAGGAAWSWHNGNLHEEGMAVGFDLEGIEVQIAYTNPLILQRDLDELLVDHKPDTLNHKVAEGLLKAEPLIAPERLAAWRAQVARYPQGLADAMMRHHLAEPTPWKWFGYLLQRDSALWCRELLVDACYRLFGVLAGLNHRYYTASSSSACTALPASCDTRRPISPIVSRRCWWRRCPRRFAPCMHSTVKCWRCSLPMRRTSTAVPRTTGAHVSTCRRPERSQASGSAMPAARAAARTGSGQLIMPGSCPLAMPTR